MIPHAVICSLTLLMMDKCLSETCWADLEDQKTPLFVASSWFWFYYIAYIEDAWSNTNQTLHEFCTTDSMEFLSEAPKR
jgi:hypothetical protein